MKPIAELPMLSVKHIFKGKGKVMSCTSYWEGAVAPVMTQQMATALADDFQAQFGALWAPLANILFALEYTAVTYLCGNIYFDAMSNDGPIPGNLDGNVADTKAALGDEIALLLQKRTGQRGRRYRGRFFVPGLSEEVNDNGYIHADYVDEADDLAAFLGADFVAIVPPAAGQVWHARHYCDETKDPESGEVNGPQVFVPIVDVRWVNKFATRKDRTIGGITIAR